MNGIDELASAYVLGTLSADRRREVQLRLDHDAALREAVQAWEERLLPLTALAEPVEPSPALWARIEQALPAQAVSPLAPARAPSVQSNVWQRWWGSLGFWRGFAATGFAVAAVVALVPVTRLLAPAAPEYMVALVAPNGTSPGWVVQTRGRDTLRLIPLGPMVVPEQRSLQFWTKADDWAGPVSLGLVKPGETLEVRVDQLPPMQANQLFEITLEPYEGSPTGRPTGPILYIGRSVKLT